MPEMKSGDENNLPSIEEICRSTWGPVYRFIYYKVQNREEAEEIVQEAYMKAIPYLEKGRVDSDKIIGFLKTVALNVLRDRWRMKKRRGTTADIEAIDPSESSIEDPTDSSVDRMLIEKALNELNEETRTIIELRILKGYSTAETARLLNKTEGNIRVIQHRALQLLGKILKSYV